MVPTMVPHTRWPVYYRWPLLGKKYACWSCAERGHSQPRSSGLCRLPL